MKQEPVAYVDNRCNDSIEWLVDPLKLDEGTPLYTAPRELSDELPSPVLQEHFEKGYKCAMESLQLSDEEIEKIYTKICLEDRNQITTRFARAILKKASEK